VAFIPEKMKSAALSIMSGRICPIYFAIQRKTNAIKIFQVILKRFIENSAYLEDFQIEKLL